MESNPNIQLVNGGQGHWIDKFEETIGKAKDDEEIREHNRQLSVASKEKKAAKEAAKKRSVEQNDA